MSQAENKRSDIFRMDFCCFLLKFKDTSGQQHELRNRFALMTKAQE